MRRTFIYLTFHLIKLPLYLLWSLLVVMMMRAANGVWWNQTQFYSMQRHINEIVIRGSLTFSYQLACNRNDWLLIQLNPFLNVEISKWFRHSFHWRCFFFHSSVTPSAQLIKSIRKTAATNQLVTNLWPSFPFRFQNSTILKRVYIRRMGHFLFEPSRHSSL